MALGREILATEHPTDTRKRSEAREYVNSTLVKYCAKIFSDYGRRDELFSDSSDRRLIGSPFDWRLRPKALAALG